MSRWRYKTKRMLLFARNRVADRAMMRADSRENAVYRPDRAENLSTYLNRMHGQDARDKQKESGGRYTYEQ